MAYILLISQNIDDLFCFTYVIWGVAGAFLIVYLVTLILKRNAKKINKDPEYAVGLILTYKLAFADNRKEGCIKYTFTANNIIYNKSYGNIFAWTDKPNEYKFVPRLRDDRLNGKKYVVKYCKSNPKNSAMLFNCPIKEDNDLAAYLEEFKINPPILICNLFGNNKRVKKS